MIPTNIQLLLNLRRLPGRIPAEMTATLLGLHTDHVTLLVKHDLLTPLGGFKGDSTVKWFASVEILERASDVEFLSKATALIARSHRERNEERKTIRVGRGRIQADAAPVVEHRVPAMHSFAA